MIYTFLNCANLKCLMFFATQMKNESSKLSWSFINFNKILIVLFPDLSKICRSDTDPPYVGEMKVTQPLGEIPIKHFKVFRFLQDDHVELWSEIFDGFWIGISVPSMMTLVAGNCFLKSAGMCWSTISRLGQMCNSRSW